MESFFRWSKDDKKSFAAQPCLKRSEASDGETRRSAEEAFFLSGDLHRIFWDEFHSSDMQDNFGYKRRRKKEQMIFLL